MREYQEKYVKMLMDYTSSKACGAEGIKDIVSAGLPSLEKFAVGINVTRSTLDKWAVEHEEFALAMQEARARICDTLCDAGASKAADPSFVKFLLVTKYGYEDDKGEGAEDKPFELTLTVVK